MTLPRVRRPELMDAAEQDPAELAGALRHVASVNRWLGGHGPTRRHLIPTVDRGDPGILLDVGTGNASTLRSLVEWARARTGRPWWGVGLDLHPAILRSARTLGSHDDGVRLVRGDGLRLPLSDGSVDATVCTLTLHHFDEGAAVALLREMGRVSRGPVLVNDLRRSLPAYLAARLLAATWWRRNRLTRSDGPLSVLRSFTPREMERLGHAAGFERVRVHGHLPFRLVLEADGLRAESARDPGRAAAATVREKGAR